MMLRLKTILRKVLPPKVIIPGFAAAGNLQPESNKVGELLNLKSRTETVKGVKMNRKGFVSFEERIQEVLEEKNRKGLTLDESTYNTLISDMCKLDHMAPAAIGLYDEMRVKGMSLNETTYTSLIDLFCNREEVDNAHKFLIEMIDTGFSPSVATFNRLVHGYCEDDMVREAAGILRVMAERGLSPDVDIYNNVITWDGDENLELDTALELKADMVDKGILPHAETYSWLIVSLCFERRLLEAFDLFREMLRGGLSTGEVTYSSLMNACCLEAEFSKAFHLHDAMIHKGFLSDSVTEFSPSLVTYNALIYGYCFLGRFEEALEILRRMDEMGLSPETVSYSTVISGFCQIGEPGKAYELMVEMNEKGVRWGIDVAVYKSLMKGLSDEVTYTSLINAYCAEGEVYKANTLFDEMTHNGSLRGSVLSSVLINGLDKKARTREAKKILLLMVYSWGVDLPTFTYDTLIENCGNNEFKSVVELVKGLWMRGLENEAASVWNTVLQWNHKSDGAVYNNLLIVEHCKCGNVDKAYNMYMEMVHYGFASHMFSVLALIKALSYGRRYNEIRRVIQNVLRGCNLNDSELHKALNEIDASQGFTDALLNVLAEKAMDGLLLNGGNQSAHMLQRTLLP